jgi:hypothetical protein
MSKQREQQQSVAACEAVLADLEARAATLVVQSGHPDRVGERLLLGVKRTSQFLGVMSAFDPKRTSMMSEVPPPETPAAGSIGGRCRSGSLQSRLPRC